MSDVGNENAWRFVIFIHFCICILFLFLSTRLARIENPVSANIIMLFNEKNFFLKIRYIRV